MFDHILCEETYDYHYLCEEIHDHRYLCEEIYEEHIEDKGTPVLWWIAKDLIAFLISLDSTRELLFL